MKIFKILLGLPALAIHEFSHILAIIFLGAKGQGVEVNAHIDDFGVTVHYETDCNWKKNIISLAPIGGFTIWALTICLTSGFVFFALAIYSLLYIRVFFPSPHDIEIFNSKLKLTEDTYEIPELYD
jgi:hypothetical protein